MDNSFQNETKKQPIDVELVLSEIKNWLDFGLDPRDLLDYEKEIMTLFEGTNWIEKYI